MKQPRSVHRPSRLMGQLDATRRRYIDFPVVVTVAVLIWIGVGFYFLKYLSEKEVRSPIEFGILSATLGGFLLVFGHRPGARVEQTSTSLLFIGKLYWAAALAFVILGLVAPMLKTPNLGPFESWTLVVTTVATLVIAGLAFSVACSLMAYFLWRLR